MTYREQEGDICTIEREMRWDEKPKEEEKIIGTQRGEI